MQECEIVNNHLKSIGLNPTWWESVKTGKVDPWANLIKNDTNNQMRQFILKVK
jgi:hypothetical protein